MADFSVQAQQYNKVIITPFSLESIGTELRSNITSNATMVAAAAWPTTNKAIFIPFLVFQPFTVMKIFTEIGSASGNIDVGIYDDQKNRLVSIGGVAQAGSSAIQTFDVTDTTLNPGVYYMAAAADNTTGTVFRSAFSNLVWAGAAGLLMQTSAYTLPNPANWVAAVDAYVPFLAVLGRTTV